MFILELFCNKTNNDSRCLWVISNIYQKYFSPMGRNSSLLEFLFSNESIYSRPSNWGCTDTWSNQEEIFSKFDTCVEGKPYVWLSSNEIEIEILKISLPKKWLAYIIWGECSDNSSSQCICSENRISLNIDLRRKISNDLFKKSIICSFFS